MVVVIVQTLWLALQVINRATTVERTFYAALCPNIPCHLTVKHGKTTLRVICEHREFTKLDRLADTLCLSWSRNKHKMTYLANPDPIHNLRDTPLFTNHSCLRWSLGRPCISLFPASYHTRPHGYPTWRLRTQIQRRPGVDGKIRFAVTVYRQFEFVLLFVRRV